MVAPIVLFFFLLCFARTSIKKLPTLHPLTNRPFCKHHADDKIDRQKIDRVTGKNRLIFVGRQYRPIFICHVSWALVIFLHSTGDTFLQCTRSRYFANITVTVSKSSRIHCVSKTWCRTFCNNFINCQSIVNILSLLKTAKSYLQNKNIIFCRILQKNLAVLPSDT